MTALDWPIQFDRTDPAEREPNNHYRLTLRESVDDLETEMDRLCVDSWRLSTAARHQKQNRTTPTPTPTPTTLARSSGGR